jgi:hypothetical protein
VNSRVRVTGHEKWVRFFLLRYEGGCCDGQQEVERRLNDELPKGTLWHSACVGAGEAGERYTEGCYRCVSRAEGGEPAACPFERTEVVWTDVLVDFGEVKARQGVDFSGERFRMYGRLPRVRACSGGRDDILDVRWTAPWGGPFSCAYGQEYSMLGEWLRQFWRGGERLLTDVGDKDCWEVYQGILVPVRRGCGRLVTQRKSLRRGAHIAGEDCTAPGESNTAVRTPRRAPEVGKGVDTALDSGMP